MVRKKMDKIIITSAVAGALVAAVSYQIAVL
jgi:hypothetical protein